MATVTTGLTISAGDTVTAQSLHDMIEDALITNLTSSDFGAGIGLLFVGSTAPNPTNFPFWYDTSPDDSVFKVWAEPWKLWLAAGPDRFEIPLKNVSGQVVPRGALVVAAGASEFTIATSPSLNAIGFLQATAVTDAWGPVCTCGIGYVVFGSGHNGAHLEITAGQYIHARSTIAGYCQPGSHGGNTASGPLYGIWLEGNRSGASGHGSAFRSLIFGPKLTSPPA